MEEESSDFDKRPAIEKPSLDEVGYERLHDVKDTIKRIEGKIYGEVDDFIEQRAKPFEDITGEEGKELKQRLFETYKDQQITPLKEDVKVYEESLGTTINNERRVSRKIVEAEREIKISEFDLQRAFERTLRDIRREKGKKA